MPKIFLYIISNFNEKELYPLSLREKCKCSLIINYNLLPFSMFTKTDTIPQSGDKIIVLSKINKIFYNNYGAEISLYSLLCEFTLNKEIFGPNSSQILSPKLPLEFMLTSQHYSHLYHIQNIRYGNTSKLINSDDIKKLLGVSILRNIDVQPQVINNNSFLINNIYPNFNFIDSIQGSNNITIKNILKFKNIILNQYYIVNEKNNKFSNNKIKKHNIKEEKINYAKTVLNRATSASIKNKLFIPYRRKIIASKCGEIDDKIIYKFLFENEVKDMDSFFYYIGSESFINKLFPIKDFPRYRYNIIPLLSNVYFESDKIRNMQTNITLDYLDNNKNLKGSTSGRPDGMYVLYDKLFKSFSIYILELKKHYSETGDLSEFEALQKIQSNKNMASNIIIEDENNETPLEDDNNDLEPEDWLIYEKLAFNNGSQGIYEDSHTKQADLFFSRLDSSSYYYNLNPNVSDTLLINSVSGEQEFLSEEQQNLLKKNSLIKLTSIITNLLLGEKINDKYRYQDKFKELITNSEPINVTIFKALLNEFKSNLHYIFIIDKITDIHKTEMINVINYHNAKPLIYLMDRFIITEKQHNKSFIKTIFKELHQLK